MSKNKSMITICHCGFKIKVPDCQFEEFMCGVCGPLNCPDCKRFLFSESMRKDNGVIDIEDVNENKM
jgi:hypothetical protein